MPPIRTMPARRSFSFRTPRSLAHLFLTLTHLFCGYSSSILLLRLLTLSPFSTSLPIAIASTASLPPTSAVVATDGHGMRQSIEWRLRDLRFAQLGHSMRHRSYIKTKHIGMLQDPVKFFQLFEVSNVPAADRSLHNALYLDKNGAGVIIPQRKPHGPSFLG